MLYKIAKHDAPMLVASLQELMSPSLTSSRARKAIYNRLSQGMQKLLGLKGKVNSLSIILTQSTVEIGIEMTQETFASGSGGSVVMEVAKVTLNDGFVWHDVRDAGFNDRVRAAQVNRQTGLKVVELLEMTEDQYHAISSTQVTPSEAKTS